LQSTTQLLLLKRVLFIFILVLSQHSLYSQFELYAGGELIGGTMTGSQFNSDLLEQKNYSPVLGGQLNVSIRMFDVFAIEAGIGQHWNRVRLRDNDFEQQAEDFSIDIKNTNYYWNYYIALSAFVKIKQTDTYFYGKFALSFNNYGESSVNDQSSFAISSLSIDRTLDYTSNYRATNYSLIPEVGIQHKFFKGNTLGLGIRYNIGQSTAFESEYTATDNISGQSTTDGLTSKGNNLTFTLSYNIRLYHIPEREKKPKKKKVKTDDIAIDVSKQDEDEDDPSTGSGTSEEPVVHKKKYEDEGRKMMVSERIKVHSNKVKILIWDHQTVDGDRVSLVLNDEWILENYTLKKEKYEMEVELVEGVNTFVLHALNLGKVSPNTAAFIVIEGDKEHRLTLQSNMKRSGILEINYKP